MILLKRCKDTNKVKCSSCSKAICCAQLSRFYNKAGIAADIVEWGMDHILNEQFVHQHSIEKIRVGGGGKHFVPSFLREFQAILRY